MMCEQVRTRGFTHRAGHTSLLGENMTVIRKAIQYELYCTVLYINYIKKNVKQRDVMLVTVNSNEKLKHNFVSLVTVGLCKFVLWSVST